jgi:hypothetical protein
MPAVGGVVYGVDGLERAVVLAGCENRRRVGKAAHVFGHGLGRKGLQAAVAPALASVVARHHAR